MPNALLQLDAKTTQFINGLIPHNRFLDAIFSFFALKGMSFIIWLVLVFLLLIFEETHLKKERKKILIVFFVSLAATAILVTGLKKIVHRPRPCFTDLNRFQLISTDYNCPTDFSFPSGHASVAFASSAVLAFFDKKRKWFYYGMALLISLSRIYLGVHYFLDVVAGAIIGYYVSKIILWYKTKTI